MPFPIKSTWNFVVSGGGNRVIKIFVKWFRSFFAGGKDFFQPPAEAMTKMIAALEAAEIGARLPDLAGRRVLEVAPHLLPLGHLLKVKGPLITAGIGMKEGYSVRGRWENLPFQSSSVHFVLCRTHAVKREFLPLIREAARVLKPGGQMLVVDLHPFNPVVQGEFRSKPVVEEGLFPGFERYFKIFLSTGLVLEQVREIFFDSSLKKFFKDKRSFERLRKQPLLIFFSLHKEIL